MELLMKREDLKEMSQPGQGIGSKPILSRQDCFQQSHNLRLYPGEQLIQKEKADTYLLAKLLDIDNLYTGRLEIKTIVPSTVDAHRKFLRQRHILIIFALMNRRGISAHVRVGIFQWREVSVHVHEASVHVREVSVHVHEASVHVREVSVHVHEASVHVPKSLMQRQKAVIFPVSIPVHEDVPIISIKQFKLYKST